MNNEQFRRLLFDNPPSSVSSNTTKSSNINDHSKKDVASGSGSGGEGRGANTARPAMLLGAKMRSNLPMTPRSVKPSNFARQLAEHRQELSLSAGADGPPATKKFKSSAAPKGTKYGERYQDRTALRRQLETTTGGQEEDPDEKEDVEKRVKALEEMVKLGQIDQPMFEKLRKDLGVGGNVERTHLVKGLDWDLLKRARAGDDVLQPPVEEKRKEVNPASETQRVDSEPPVDVDDELDRLLTENGDGAGTCEPREVRVKKGNMAAPRLSRNEILRQLRAGRPAVTDTTSPEPTLGSKFKKVRDRKGEKKRWIEEDKSGRRKEILEITDMDGTRKRKVRWLDKAGSQVDKNGLLIVDQNAKRLGMEVPKDIALKAKAKEESDDEDMFTGVGADYDPLGDLEQASSSGSEDEEIETEEQERKPSEITATTTDGSEQPRNYFGITATTEDDKERSNPLLNDPTLLAALKRAAAMKPDATGIEALEDEEEVDPETLRRRRKFFEEAKRREAEDSLDIDYGFGSSRIDDEEDEEGFMDEESGRGIKKRKRGPKKRKANKDSASDVLQILEGRRKEA